MCQIEMLEGEAVLEIPRMILGAWLDLQQMRGRLIFMTNVKSNTGDFWEANRPSRLYTIPLLYQDNRKWRIGMVYLYLVSWR